jgi:hypothetical protein
LDEIEEYLTSLKATGRSSPGGIHWHRFVEALRGRVGARAIEPPLPPLILAAASESNASKLYRLGEQLRWAAAHGVLADALALLEAVPRDGWNRGSAETWHRDGYWTGQ